MKAILLMFDSLNRHMLPPYGCAWTNAPNFQRLAERTAVFDNCYAGSLPCMPARRELHTGRYNFLHASWGPIEPFDDSMPEILKDAGIYTHLITDHYHYFEDGGATYHTRFASWELARGQEGDPWKGVAGDFPIPENLNDHGGLWGRQDWVNRSFMRAEEEFSQAQTMHMGMEFIRRNAQADHWFLQLETFDPHEPYYTPQRYKDLYPHQYDGPILDWPPYGRGNLTKQQSRHLVYEYAALLSMCDEYLGQVLDLMDELDLWKDTMLIVNTDHGFLLGEHGWWAKVVQPFYNEVARIPLFIWDPRGGGAEPAKAGAGADDRPARYAAGVLRPGAAHQYAGQTAGTDRDRRHTGARGGAVWFVWRICERDRWEGGVYARPGRSRKQTAV